MIASMTKRQTKFQVSAGNKVPGSKHSSFIFVLLGIWAALLPTYAVFVFLMPHGPDFAPELGPAGAFLYFVINYSIPYFVIALLFGATKFICTDVSTDD